MIFCDNFGRFSAECHSKLFRLHLERLESFLLNGFYEETFQEEEKFRQHTTTGIAVENLKFKF